LQNDGAQLVVRRIRVDVKGLVVVWKLKKYFLSQQCPDLVKGNASWANIALIWSKAD
jgi:hypothetical protein